jgi:hypothetical protein
MPVSYPSTIKRFGEDFCVELWIRPGARDRTYIDEQIDRYLPEQGQKFGDRAR